jgi:PadR family transcriptional regulator PadR
MGSAGELPDGVGPPRNFLRTCLLLLIAERPSHGYDMAERLNALGFGHVPSGRLYRVLREMEREDLIDSSWEGSEAGPPRRTYELSVKGARSLRSSAGTLRRTGRVVGSFLDRYDEITEQIPPGYGDL